jgi:hypothetical protein
LLTGNSLFEYIKAELNGGEEIPLVVELSTREFCSWSGTGAAELARYDEVLSIF